MTSRAPQVLSCIVQAILPYLQGSKLLCALFYICLIYEVARTPLGQIQDSTIDPEKHDVDCTQDANCTVCPPTSKIADSPRGIKHRGGKGQKEHRVTIPCVARLTHKAAHSVTPAAWIIFSECLRETQWNADKSSSDRFTKPHAGTVTQTAKKSRRALGGNGLLVNPRSHPSSADYGCWWPASGNSRHHSERTPDASLLSHWSTLPLLEHARWICSWLSSSANKKVYRFYPVHQALP